MLLLGQQIQLSVLCTTNKFIESFCPLKAIRLRDIPIVTLVVQKYPFSVSSLQFSNQVWPALTLSRLDWNTGSVPWTSLSRARDIGKSLLHLLVQSEIQLLIVAFLTGSISGVLGVDADVDAEAHSAQLVRSGVVLQAILALPPVTSPPSSQIPLPLIHPPCHLLPHLIATNHDRTCWCHFQTPCRPASEQAGYAFVSVYGVQESWHGELFRPEKSFASPSRLLRFALQDLLSCLSHVEGSRDHTRESSTGSSSDEAVHKRRGVVAIPATRPRSSAP